MHGGGAGRATYGLQAVGRMSQIGPDRRPDGSRQPQDPPRVSSDSHFLNLPRVASGQSGPRTRGAPESCGLVRALGHGRGFPSTGNRTVGRAHAFVLDSNAARGDHFVMSRSRVCNGAAAIGSDSAGSCVRGAGLWLCLELRRECAYNGGLRCRPEFLNLGRVDASHSRQGK